MKRLISQMIRFYRKRISPLKKGPSCRFCPTCSRYALDAVKEWGAITGAGMAAWRVLRCNPFGRGGFDAVPLNPKRHREDESGVTTEEGNLS